MTEQQIHRKRELKRIDLEILERIMIVMYEAGKSNKTTISRNSKMSYDKCIKYLNCLEMLEFVKCQKDEKSYVYDLTPQGIRFCKRKLVAKLDSNSLYETEYNHHHQPTSTKIFV